MCRRNSSVKAIALHPRLDYVTVATVVCSGIDNMYCVLHT